MTLPGPVVKFSDVTTESSSDYETGLWNVSLELNPGELLLVRVEHEDERLALADTMEGLLAPAQGSVEFLGEDWARMPADRAAQQRGKIGRLFEEGGWISDMEVDQNIMLAQLHHTDRSVEEITKETLDLARLFGLPGLPRGRPGSVRRSDLRKAACLRAFVGQPLLVILEQPVRGLHSLMPPLLNAVHSARKRGCAILWTVSDVATWNNSGIRATARARMIGAQLLMETSS